MCMCVPVHIYIYVGGFGLGDFQRSIPPQLFYLCDFFTPTNIFPSIQMNVLHERPLLLRRTDKGI